MQIIISKTSNPYHNIATEEYLLKKSEEDIFLLYINSKSIIVGKHQNTLSEINYSYTTENNIPVVRRLSGGGTVFHDGGNINFCFISSGNDGKLVNFKKYTQPIIDFLQSIQVNAYLGKRNDILINGAKVSGNASHVFKNRVLHHGTLLFNSELKTLTACLKNDPLKFKDKAIKSVRSEVTNIYDHLQTKLDITTFTQCLKDYIVNNYETKERILSLSENEIINKLVSEKYNTWEWNFAYGPKYKLRKRIKGNNNKYFELDISVSRGNIDDVKLRSNIEDIEILEFIVNSLKDVQHQPIAITKALVYLSNYTEDITKEQIVSAIF